MKLLNAIVNAHLHLFVRLTGDIFYTPVAALPSQSIEIMITDKLLNNIIEGNKTRQKKISYHVADSVNQLFYLLNWSSFVVIVFDVCF